MKQEECLAILFTDVRQGQLHFFGEQFSTLVGTAVIFNMILGFGGDRAAVPLSQMRSATIPGDCHDPGFDRSAPIPAIKISQHPQKRLLGHVLGFVMLAKHTVAQQVNLISKSLNKFRDCALVALHTLVD
nr:hypothetical protein [Bremerella cremea]